METGSYGGIMVIIQVYNSFCLGNSNYVNIQKKRKTIGKKKIIKVKACCCKFAFHDSQWSR